MGIGNISNNMSGMPMAMTGVSDAKNKKIQNEITGVQQEMRALSSKEELSVTEKENERKTLRKKITSLNTELKQHEEEFLKSQKREIMMSKLQDNMGLAKEETAKDQTNGAALDKAAEKRPESQKTGIDEKGAKPSELEMDAKKELSQSENAATSSAVTSAQQPRDLQGTVISRTKDGVVILKDDAKQNMPQSEEAKSADTSEKATKPLDPESGRGLSRREIHEIVSADASVQQADRQETVIARIQGGIAILKGEIKQDEIRGIDTEQKQAELKKMEQREERAQTFQAPVFGESNTPMKPAAKTGETPNSTQLHTENNTYVRAFQLNQEMQASQQRFYISLDN